MEAIFTRRSIRKYTKEPVAETAIKDLLAAAMSAPSAGNERPWHFVVIRNRALLDEIPKFHAHAEMVRMAPVAILVCADLRQTKFDGWYWIQDCSAAVENILLAAAGRDLGSVWLGVYPNKERVDALQALLGLPERITPFALVAVGHSAEHKPPEDRYEEARVHYDRW